MYHFDVKTGKYEHFLINDGFLVGLLEDDFAISQRSALKSDKPHIVCVRQKLIYDETNGLSYSVEKCVFEWGNLTLNLPTWTYITARVDKTNLYVGKHLLLYIRDDLQKTVSPLQHICTGGKIRNLTLMDTTIYCCSCKNVVGDITQPYINPIIS